MGLAAILYLRTVSKFSVRSKATSLTPGFAAELLLHFSSLMLCKLAVSVTILDL